MKPSPDGAVRRSRCSTENPRRIRRGVAMLTNAALTKLPDACAVEILADPGHADAIEATAREIETEAARLDLAIAEAENVAEPWLDYHLQHSNFALSRYDMAFRPLDERIAKLKDERAALGDPSPQRTPRASREHWRRRWRRC